MPKIFKILIFSAFIFLCLPALAATGDMPQIQNPFDNPKLQIKLSDTNIFSAVQDCKDDASKKCVYWIGEYIAAIFKYAIGAVGILAAVVLMVGGIIWLTSGGNQTRVGEAKSYIAASLSGLIIALSSYLILYQINPELTKIKPIKVGVPEAVKTSANMPTSVLQCVWTSIPVFHQSATDRCISTIGNGWKENSGKCKEEDKPSSSLLPQVCCCPPMGGGWVFDGGIQSQVSDASSELNKLLNCMRKDLPQGVGRISSISDSNNRATQGFNNCDTCPTGTTGSGCEHICQSCHYGGGTLYSSQAVDFGDEENKDIIIAAAKNCTAGYIKDEGDHIHVSDSVCAKN